MCSTVGIDVQYLAWKEGYQDNQRSYHVGTDTDVLTDQCLYHSGIPGAYLVADERTAGRGESDDRHERNARYAPDDVGDGQRTFTQVFNR